MRGNRSFGATMFAERVKGQSSRKRLTLLVSASISALCALSPDAARAQAVPPGCSPDPAVAGATVTCVVPAPSAIDPISTDVPDLTLVIGDTNTATTVADTGGGFAAISMVGGGDQTLDVVNAGSTITGGQTGVYVSVAPGGRDLVINSAGSISGDSYGLRASDDGTGDTIVTSANVAVLTGGPGILLRNGYSSRNLSLSASETTGGIAVDNLGSGDTSIMSGNATGGSAVQSGIYAINGGATGNLTVTSTGLAQGSSNGIFAINRGTGDTTILSNNAVATGTAGYQPNADSAIYAMNDGDADNLTVTSTGSATGLGGLFVFNRGTGDTTVVANNVDATGLAGITAYAATGDVSVTTTGTVNGQIGGISAIGNADLTVDAGPSVIGGDYGIYLSERGTGTITVKAHDVVGNTGAGVLARSYGSSDTIISVVTTGTVSGGNNGIYTLNHTSGDTIITADNTVATGPAFGRSYSGNAIFASNDRGAGNLTVTSTGTASGASGIFVTNQSVGNATVTANIVIGREYSGIVAVAAVGDVSITSTGVVSGNLDGISAISSGALTIDARASVTGGYNGVVAREMETGAIDITTQDVLGTTGNGIDATAGYTGTGVRVISNGTATGGGHGILVTNRGIGDTVISANNTVASLPPNIAYSTGDAIFAMNGANAANLTITSTGSAIGAKGVSAFNYGTGNTTIHVNSAVADQYSAITAFGANGDVSITSTGEVNGYRNGVYAIGSAAVMVDAGAAVVGGETGIFVSEQGTGQTDIIAHDVLGVENNGILARSIGTDVNVTVTGTATGGRSGIYVFNDGTGSTRIAAHNTVATGPSDGPFSPANAIYAINGMSAGDLIVTSTGSAIGATGIYLINQGTGDTSVSSVDAISDGAGSGIVVYGARTTGNLTVTSTGITEGATGISAQLAGTGALSVSAENVVGAAANGIYARNQIAGTDVTVTAGGSVLGSRDGIRARNSGTGELRVTAVDTTGTTGNGITALNTYNMEAGAFNDPIAATNLVVTSTGTAVGGRNGIYALNRGTGDTTIATDDTMAIGIPNGSMNSGNAIYAVNGTTAGYLTIISTGVASGTSSGIVAVNGGTGGLTISANEASGAGSTGIIGAAVDGPVAIRSSGAVTGSLTGIYGVSGASLIVQSTAPVSGGIDGIVARANGSGTLMIAATDVTGSTGFGIFADTGVGAASGVSVTSAGMVTGGATGLLAMTRGDGNVAVTANSAQGGTGAGISAEADGNGAVAVTSNGLVSGGTIGIETRSLGDGANTVNAGATVNGGSSGILAATYGAGPTVIHAIDVSGTSADGIFSRTEGSGGMDVTATGTATGGRSGIYTLNQGTGGTTVTSFDASGGSFGMASYNGATAQGLTVTSTGTATATGGQGIGLAAVSLGNGQVTVSANNAGGAVAGVVAASRADLFVTVTGDVSGGVAGVYGVLNGGGTAVIVNTGTIRSAGVGVRLQSTDDAGTVTVNNSGLIGGDMAAIGSTSATTLNNSGAVDSRVAFSAFGDRVNNIGLFNAVGDSDFGSGTDVFANTGLVRVTGAVTLAGLEQFISSGAVTLVNGAAGDVLTLPGSFAGNGTLALDVDFRGGVADRLVIGGAATGSTVLSLNVIDQGTGFGQPIVLVDAGAGTTADAFSLAGAPVVSSGFRAYALAFNPATSDFVLNSGATVSAFRPTTFAAGAQAVWYASADGWAAHLRSVRDSGYVSGPFWLEMQGSRTDVDRGLTYTGLGFDQAISLNYDQDYFGAQAGFDLVSPAGGAGFTAGVTGGYTSSDLTFDATADRVNYSVADVGGYAGLTAGSLFLNGLFKYDFVRARINALSSGYTARINGHSYGGRVEAGYRGEFGSFFLEPSASIEYVRTDLHDFAALGAEVRLGRAEGLRGMAGAKIGGHSLIAGGSTLTYYVSGQAVHEFDGDNVSTVDFGSGSFSNVNRRLPTYGRGELGLNIRTSSGVSGFMEFSGDRGRGYRTYGGRAGLRVAF